MKLEFKKLGDIATYINGYAFKPTDWSQNGKAIIRIQNLNNDNAEFNYFSGDINEKYIVKKGDILISWSASIGVYEWNKEDSLLNQHIFKVDFNKEEINKIYFKHMVSIALNKATQFMHGSTMKHITKKYFDDIKIPVPSLEIQKNIADILDKAKDLTSKRKEQLRELDLLVKSKFIEMFGDLEHNINKFNKAKMKDICNKITDGTHKTPNYLNEGIKFISAKDIKTGKLDLTNTKYISVEEYYEIQKRCQLENGDILLSKSGSIGTPVVLDVDEPLGIFESLAVLKIKNNIVNNIYVCEFLRSYSAQRKILFGTKGISIKHLHLNVLRELEILIPPIELQNKFADFAKQVDKLKFEMEKSLKELEDNFNSLMQKAFKGEIFN